MQRTAGPTWRFSSFQPFGDRGICSQRRGFVLLAVLVVIMLVSMVSLSLMFLLRAEETAASAGLGAEHAWSAAMSGVQEAIRVASRSVPGSLEWHDNPDAFWHRLVTDDGVEQWYFSVFGIADADRQETRFGLTDELSKLNVNTATESMLAKLPGMSSYLADGLLDFLDPDDTPRPEGAEQEYYDALSSPYAAANGPISSLDELLLVRGFTPAIVYGEDANLNCRLDLNENDADGRFPPDNKDGKLDAGLRHYLTIHSYDLNQANDGNRRTDINDAGHLFPTNDFPEALVQYVAALRRNNVKLNHAAELLEASGKFKGEDGKEIELQSGIGKDELADVLDRFTATNAFRLPGLINVNTASAAVLQTIPEIDESLAETIVAARRGLRDEQRRTPAWLFEEGVVTAEVFKKIAPYLTARSLQFRFHVVGYGVPSGRYRVVEAVIDLGGRKPALLYLRDLTRLGLPFHIDVDPPEDVFQLTLGRKDPHG